MKSTIINKRGFSFIELTLVLSLSSILLYFTTISINEINFYNSLKAETNKIILFLNNGFYKKTANKILRKNVSTKSIFYYNNFNKEIYDLEKNKINILHMYSKNCSYEIKDLDIRTFTLKFECKLKNPKRQRKTLHIFLENFKNSFPTKIINYNIDKEKNILKIQLKKFN